MAKKKKPPKQRLAVDQNIFIKQEVRRLANKQMQQIRHEVADSLVDAVVACFALTLHDEFDFGKQRIVRGLERFLSEFYAIVEERITLDDIKAVLLEECRLEIAEYSDRRVDNAKS